MGPGLSPAGASGLGGAHARPTADAATIRVRRSHHESSARKQKIGSRETSRKGSGAQDPVDRQGSFGAEDGMEIAARSGTEQPRALLPQQGSVHPDGTRIDGTLLRE